MNFHCGRDVTFSYVLHCIAFLSIQFFCLFSLSLLVCVSWEGEGWFRTGNIELCHPWSKLLTWHASAQFWFIFIIWFLLPPFFLSSLYLWFFTLNERGGTCILLCFPLHGCYFNVFLPALCVCVSCEWEGDGWFRTGNIVPSPNLGGNCFATMEPANYFFSGWLPLALFIYDGDLS